MWVSSWFWSSNLDNQIKKIAQEQQQSITTTRKQKYQVIIKICNICLITHQNDDEPCIHQVVVIYNLFAWTFYIYYLHRLFCVIQTREQNLITMYREIKHWKNWLQFTQKGGFSFNFLPGWTNHMNMMI